MDRDSYSNPAYRGTKNFTQHQVKTANATGFGAAADDYSERGIDLNEQLVRNKPATYFFRMKGDAMREAGIFDGDVLIVDRSIKLTNGKVIVAILNGELLSLFTVLAQSGDLNANARPEALGLVSLSSSTLPVTLPNSGGYLIDTLEVLERVRTAQNGVRKIGRAHV